MKQQSRKIIALLAFMLFSAKGRAEMQTANENDSSNSVMEKIQAKLRAQPELACAIPGLEKLQLENLIQQEMSDEDYASIQNLLTNLANENVQMEFVNPKDMTLASQEVSGGSSK